jgi:hypothetical protein
VSCSDNFTLRITLLYLQYPTYLYVRPDKLTNLFLIEYANPLTVLFPDSPRDIEIVDGLRKSLRLPTLLCPTERIFQHFFYLFTLRNYQ